MDTAFQQQRGDLTGVFLCRNMQRRSPKFRIGADIGPMVQQNPGRFDCVVLRRNVQRCYAPFGLRVDIGPLIQQVFNQGGQVQTRCNMHACLALIVHRIHGWIAEHLQVKFIFFHSEIRNHRVSPFSTKSRRALQTARAKIAPEYSFTFAVWQ